VNKTTDARGKANTYFFWVIVLISGSDLANLRRDHCIAAILLDQFAVIVPDWIRNYVVLDRRVTCQKINNKMKTEHKEMHKKIKIVSYFFSFCCFTLLLYLNFMIYFVVIYASWLVITAQIFVILIRYRFICDTHHFEDPLSADCDEPHMTMSSLMRSSNASSWSDIGI